MFKKLYFFTFVIVFSAFTATALAQEKATSSASVTSADSEKIRSLKEKLATKVAELRENQTRGFYGEIASLSRTSFTLVTREKEVKVRYSDDAVIFKLDAKGKTEAKATDLKNTLTASILGLYDTESGILTANMILLESSPEFISGEITAIDKTTAIITLKTAGEKTADIDYEKTTSSSEYQGEGKIVKSGLSRFSAGDRLYSWVNETGEDDGGITLSAVKILRLPKNLLHPEATPSSSPSASPKSSPKTKTSPSP